MNISELSPGDWISISWIPYKLYVLENKNKLVVTSPAWDHKDSMSFDHWRFLNGNRWEYLGKSKPNLLYNKATSLLGYIHPVVMK